MTYAKYQMPPAEYLWCDRTFMSNESALSSQLTLFSKVITQLRNLYLLSGDCGRLRLLDLIKIWLLISQDQNSTRLKLPCFLGVEDEVNGIGRTTVTSSCSHVAPGLRTRCFAVRRLEAEFDLEQARCQHVACRYHYHTAVDLPHTMCLVGAGVCEWPSLCLAHNGRRQVRKRSRGQRHHPT